MGKRIESNGYNIVELDASTWRINDHGFDLFYLIAGEREAVLLDTGFGSGDLHAMCRALTPLPVRLVLTHGHPDHVLGAGQFDVFHVAEPDSKMVRYYGDEDVRRELLKSFLTRDHDYSGVIRAAWKGDPDHSSLPDMTKEQSETFAPWVHQGIGSMTVLADDQIVDLGGRELRILFTPGHTPGSICVLDASHGYLFSGDTILSSHHLINLPESCGLSVFRDSLAHIKEVQPHFHKIHAGHMISPLPSSHVDVLLAASDDIRDKKIQPETVESIAGPSAAYYFGKGNSILLPLE